MYQFPKLVYSKNIASSLFGAPAAATRKELPALQSLCILS